MPTDPVQVVAEARCLHRSDGGPCHITWNGFHPQCAVAALKAAGALMPREALTWTQHAEQAVVVAQHERDEARESAQAWLVELEKSVALLQEALSVLGRHHKQIIKASVPTGFCVCGERWLCRRASLAEKIEKALG